MSAPPVPYHGLFRRGAARALAINLTLATAGALAWKYGVAEPRKKRYAEFYRTYDPVADGKRMSEMGLFKRGGKASDFR